MASPALDALRFLRGWAGHSRGAALRGVEVDDIQIEDDSPPAVPVGGAGEHVGRSLRAWRYRSAAAAIRSPRPGWVLLHGATRPGPHHPEIVRCATALAGAGGDVLVPEVTAWRELDLDPAPARRALALAARQQHRDPQVRPGGTVLAGFSFGCPQAIASGAELARTGVVRGVLGYGGYHSLDSAIGFGLTGRYERRGRTAKLHPDPYGRWVVAANFLHRIPGLDGARDVSRALGRLAAFAGDVGFPAYARESDSYKAEAMASVSARNRELFRFFAPDAGIEPDPGLARELAPQLAAAARECYPELEISHALDHPPLREMPLPPVHLIHGRHDRLIPFTETIALKRHLAPRTEVAATITGLFAHSQAAARIARPVEALRLAAAIRGLMRLHES